MAVTIYDVARQAGVGIGTVSRVLNNHGAVRESTRQRIQQVIDELGFVPDPIARSLSAGRTGALGILIPFFTRPFCVEVLSGIEAATTRLGYELIVYNIETDEQRNYYFSQLPHIRRRVEGLLIVSLSPDDEMALTLQQFGPPVVLLDAYSPLLTSFIVKNVEGAYQAMRCLLDKGHRCIGFINGIVEGHFEFNQANDRLIGVHRALTEAGLRFEPELMAVAEWSREGGKEAAHKLLTLPNRPTAIFAASDIQAIGTLEAAKDLGLRVPEDLALIGFDGVELSELLEISTVRQPMREMGESAINKLVALIKGEPASHELIRLDTTLIERKSTALNFGHRLPIRGEF